MKRPPNSASGLLRRLRHVAAVLVLIVPAAAQQWVEVRSPHFVVLCDSGEKKARETALRFEQVRAAFGMILARVKVSVPVPVEVVAFRSNKELREFAPLWKGKPIELAGYFLPGEDRGFIAVDLSAWNNWNVVFHEYTHLLMRANFTATPVWFDEGFAEYFSTLEVAGGQVTFGNLPQGRDYVLRENRWLTSEALFSVSHNSPDYNESGDHRSVFYTQSWLVVHYLMDKHKMPEASRFMNLRAQDVPMADAFQASFGMPLSKFEQVLRDYFQSNSYYSSKAPAPRTPDLDMKTYAARNLSKAESEAMLADLHLHEQDYQETAIKEFEDVLGKDPENATAHRGLGYAYLRKGDFERAEQHLGKAAGMPSAEAETHYLYALLLTRSGGWKKSGDQSVQVQMRGSGDSEKTALMKKELQAAIALNPEYADAYNLLAFAHARDGDYDGAIASERHAYELSHKENYVLNLAQFYAQRRQWQEAEALLQPLVNSTTPAIAAAARGNLQIIGQMQAFQAPPGPQAAPPVTDNASSTAVAPPAPVPVKFLKGKLVAVDCSSEPQAILTVTAGGRSWSLRAADRKRLVLVGADGFSCGWRDREVAANYRETGEGKGDLVSLEVH